MALFSRRGVCPTAEMPPFQGKAHLSHNGARVVVDCHGELSLNEADDDGWAFELAVEGTTTFLRAIKGDEIQFVWSDDCADNWFSDAGARVLSLTTKSWCVVRHSALRPSPRSSQLSGMPLSLK